MNIQCYCIYMQYHCGNYFILTFAKVFLRSRKIVNKATGVVEIGDVLVRIVNGRSLSRALLRFAHGQGEGGV